MLPVINLYTCHETLQRLDDYLDRELTLREMQLVQRHLKICHQCAHKFAFEANFLREMRAKVQRLAAPDTLRNKIACALQQANNAP